MADGLSNHLGQIGSESILDSAISSSDISSNAVTTSKINSGAVTTAKINDGAVTAAKQGFVKTGSPSAGGLSVQAGTVDTGAGSQAWVVFGTAFASRPNISFGHIDGTAAFGDVTGSPVVAGSMLVSSVTANTQVDWIAVGSGAI